jgi:hypothetical protein
MDLQSVGKIFLQIANSQEQNKSVNLLKQVSWLLGAK